MELFSRVGIPDEIISDQGTNFMSTLISQLCDTLGVRKINSTPYHPETNGLVERMNGTLKSMLRKFVHDAPKTWDKVLPYILFAYREVPEVSSGFSPFELIYGWPVRGPLSLVKNSWLDNQSDDISIVEHVINRRTKLAESTELAQQHLLESQSKMKTWYDQDARGQAYEEGEEVLVLLPTSSRSLEARWQGPFKIKRKLSDLNYEIDVGHSSKRLKIFHVNLLKRWRSRKELVLFVNSSDITEQACYSSENVESWKNVSVSDSLLPEQKQCIEDLLSKYSNVFSDQPSITNAAIHHIDTGDAKPIRLSPYRIPHSLRSKFQSEIEEMLRQGIIEKSTSDWAEDCDKAFQTLKDKLSSFPVLHLPNFSKPFVVQVDASERGLGAVLCQSSEDGFEHPIVYCSRKLLDREQKLSTTEKECLGIVWAVETFKPYIYGTTFTVETDHNPLVWLDKCKDVNQKLLRWSLILQQYSFTIRHKNGSDHKNADALSRL